MKWILKSGVFLVVAFVYFGLVDWPTNASIFKESATSVSKVNSVVKLVQSVTLESALETPTGLNIPSVKSQSTDSTPWDYISISSFSYHLLQSQYKRYLLDWKNALILLRQLDLLFPFHNFL